MLTEKRDLHPSGGRTLIADNSRLNRLINRLSENLLRPWLGRRTLAFRLIDLIKPKRPIGLSKVRLGTQTGDGGYVMVDSFDSIGAGLSLGIGANVSWDIEMANRGIDILQYDNTVVKSPVSHQRFRFHHCRVAGRDSSDGSFVSVGTMLRHVPANRDVVLKMDIEGAEWESLASISNEVMKRFSQILVELHFPLSGSPLEVASRLRTLRRIRRTHEVVHVHANNFIDTTDVEGVEIPQVIEISYLRKDLARFDNTVEEFPGEFDAPNSTTKPEIPVGALLKQSPRRRNRA
jgi:hypothetical protein